MNNGTSTESEGSFIKIPQARGKRKRRQKKVIVHTSDEEENSSDDKLIEEGNPLEDAEEPEELTKKDAWNWVKVNRATKFPWTRNDSPQVEAGMRHIRKNEFHRKNPFQVLQHFVPIQWFEDITKETNRWVFRVISYLDNSFTSFLIL